MYLPFWNRGLRRRGNNRWIHEMWDRKEICYSQFWKINYFLLLIILIWIELYPIIKIQLYSVFPFSVQSCFPYFIYCELYIKKLHDFLKAEHYNLFMLSGSLFVLSLLVRSHLGGPPRQIHPIQPSAIVINRRSKKLKFILESFLVYKDSQIIHTSWGTNKKVDDRFGSSGE